MRRKARLTVYTSYCKNIKMEVEDANYSITDLERRTYRYLQQLAKSLCLPSNVRKVHLIQLIHAKKFKSETEVKNIIQHVKSERQQLIQSRKNRKRHLQNREISSTSRSCQSPPITHTPKRSIQPVLRYSPDFTYSFNRCNSKNYLPSSNISTRSIASSDRVLRSFNLKAIRKSYAAVNVNNTITCATGVQNQSTSPKEKFVRIVSAAGKLTKINLSGKCAQRRHRPSILGGNCLAVRNDNPKQYIIPHNPQVVLNQDISIHQPKRQRTLSGIYPITTQEIPYQSYNQIQGVRLRHNDGRLSTINALVRRRSEYKPPPQRSNEISIQEILNTIDVNLSNPTHLNNNYLQYPSAGPSSSSRIYPPILESYKENDLTDRYSVYYHKKIRSEQVRYQRSNYREHDEQLPKITDVFSKFNSVPTRNLTEPLYVQVSDETERLPSYTGHPARSLANTHMLESLYNFKTSLLTNIPLLQIATTSNTKCVYSTPVIATAMAQQSIPLVAPEPFTMAPCEPDNQYRCSHDMEMPQLYELLKHPDQEFPYRRVGAADTSNHASPALSQSQVTIPEMVEDALEIISQDGDYMERIGMDIRVQCVLCSWAGPKIILEFHIRKEHPEQIHRQRSEWRLALPLGALDGPWLSRVLEHDEALCVLSAQYREPDCVVATLCSLSSDPVDKFVTITIYNKVTGEPYAWEGPIQPLPPNLPYQNDLPGLTVDLSKLDLLPNSANLKLLNKELVLKSPTKVVVGQPELNDIHIILFVRIC